MTPDLLRVTSGLLRLLPADELRVGDHLLADADTSPRRVVEILRLPNQTLHVWLADDLVPRGYRADAPVTIEDAA